MFRLNKEKKIGSFFVWPLRLSGTRFMTENEILSGGPNTECARVPICEG